MDPDGFEFDSSANYSGDPGTRMNSPGVKQAISLSLLVKSKVMLARSRPKKKEWQSESKGRNRDCNDEQSGPCDHTNGKLAKWVLRWLSCWNGQMEHNGTAVQVKLPPKADLQLECFKLEFFCCCPYYCGLVVQRSLQEE